VTRRLLPRWIQKGISRRYPSSDLAELRHAVLVRLIEQRQLSDPFGFVVYAELADAELSRSDSGSLLSRAPGTVGQIDPSATAAARR
jgi:hypothetical protein